jgi:hypothetical protein
MSDEQGQGKPRFEPPPWEREAFEALAARRAEDEALQAVLDGVKAERASARAAAEEVISSAAAATPLPAEVPVVGAGAVPKPATPADDKHVQAMLMQLQREEYTDGKGAVLVGWIAAAVTMVLGGWMLVVGLRMASAAAGKTAGVMGSAVLSIFGLCFIGMSVWVWVRTTRLKGR